MEYHLMMAQKMTRQDAANYLALHTELTPQEMSLELSCHVRTCKSAVSRRNRLKLVELIYGEASKSSPILVGSGVMEAMVGMSKRESAIFLSCNTNLSYAEMAKVIGCSPVTCRAAIRTVTKKVPKLMNGSVKPGVAGLVELMRKSK